MMMAEYMALMRSILDEHIKKGFKGCIPELEDLLEKHPWANAQADYEVYITGETDKASEEFILEEADYDKIWLYYQKFKAGQKWPELEEVLRRESLPAWSSEPPASYTNLKTNYEAAKAKTDEPERKVDI